MATTSVTSAATAQQTRDQFLQLLTTQLKYQDPMDPVNDQTFTQQLAQFSTLEGIQNLNTSFANMLRLQELTQGANLIGKSVQYTASGATKTGVVTNIAVDQDKLNLKIDGQTISIDQVTGLNA